MPDTEACCSCEKRCRTRAEMRARHGTPAEFEQAVERAYYDGYCGGSFAASARAIDKYRQEYEAAP